MDSKVRKFDVYEVRTHDGLELVATRRVSNPVPPIGSLRMLGRISGAATEADAVRIARKIYDAELFL